MNPGPLPGMTEHAWRLAWGLLKFFCDPARRQKCGCGQVRGTEGECQAFLWELYPDHLTKFLHTLWRRHFWCPHCKTEEPKPQSIRKCVPGKAAGKCRRQVELFPRAALTNSHQHDSKQQKLILTILEARSAKIKVWTGPPILWRL